MLFLIALILASAFSFLCGKALKKYPYVFYAAAVVVTVMTVILTSVNLHEIPTWLNNYVVGLFTRGAFATALWCVVMWTGAMQNGSTPIKKLMPIRGELSIFAAILTLGHNIGFGRTYFVRLFTDTGRMTANQIAASILTIIMLIIMIPLTVMSFPQIRHKMNAKLWKKIQRTAYAFYALIYVHVLIICYPMAKAGREGYLFSIFVYSAVFIGYGICRLRKWYIMRKKPENNTAVNVAGAVVFAILLFAAVFCARAESVAEKNTAVQQNVQSVTTVVTTEKSTAETTTTTAVITSTSVSSTTSSATESTSVSSTSVSSSVTTTTDVQMTETSDEDNADAGEESQQDESSDEAENGEDSSVEENVQSNNSSGAAVSKNDSVSGGNNQSDKTSGVTSSKNDTVSEKATQPNNSSVNVKNESNSQEVQTPVQNEAQESNYEEVKTPVQATEPPAEETEPSYVYKNGTYSSSAYGYDGNVYVTITIENDVITSISAYTEESDEWYFNSAQGSVISQIIGSQSTNVDAVSGATYSSEAIMSAVRKAMNSAAN